MTTKKSFTLFEIIIVIILISILYSFAINSFTNRDKQKNINKITLLNLKQELMKIDFDNNIEIKCTEDLECFVFIDGSIQDKKLTSLFKNIPTVYKYSTDLETIEFLPLELENMERYNIVFEYSCNSYGRCSEFIVEDGDDVYIFNDIKQKTIKYKYINDIDQYFNKRIKEVKDAL